MEFKVFCYNKNKVIFIWQRLANNVCFSQIYPELIKWTWVIQIS